MKNDPYKGGGDGLELSTARTEAVQSPLHAASKTLIHFERSEVMGWKQIRSQWLFLLQFERWFCWPVPYGHGVV